VLGTLIEKFLDSSINLCLAPITKSSTTVPGRAACGRIRKSSKLRARIIAIFCNTLVQFSEGHFASAVRRSGQSGGSVWTERGCRTLAVRSLGLPVGWPPDAAGWGVVHTHLPVSLTGGTRDRALAVSGFRVPLEET